MRFVGLKNFPKLSALLIELLLFKGNQLLLFLKQVLKDALTLT